jgi:hypothetical protein
LARFWTQTGVAGEEASMQSEIALPARWPACGGRSPVFRGAMKSVIWQGFKYIRNGDGIEEVYHLADDPEEKDNLADSVSPELLNDLRAVLRD